MARHPLDELETEQSKAENAAPVSFTKQVNKQTKKLGQKSSSTSNKSEEIAATTTYVDFWNNLDKYDDIEFVGDPDTAWKTISKCASEEAAYLFLVRGKEVWRQNRVVGTFVQSTEVLNGQIVSSQLVYAAGLMLKEATDSRGSKFWELVTKE